MVDESARELGEDTEEEYWRGDQDILVKNVGCRPRIPAVRLTPVYEDEIGKVFELSNCVVSGLSCLLALQTAYTYAYMCCSDHINIICTISDRKSRFIWVTILDHVNYFCLLLRTYAARKNNIGIFA